ncbi:MAG: deoxyribose-phosphate aldolase [Acidobacteria bacterium]|nr:deoxyribose-phosphate aldolase [Candidatus Sulfomarinibacter kjeldsenii]
MTESIRSIAKMIDHSLLHPTMTDLELQDGCEVALRCDVASVCIKPYAVALANEMLAGSDVVVGTVVGFPHGSSRVDLKVREAEFAMADGAKELDVVVNIGKVLSADWDFVAKEIREVNRVAVDGGAILKVIFENDFVADDESKSQLCAICSEHGVAFVKTSTGYGFVKQPDGSYTYAGATDHDLALMRRASADSVRIKAAGGVRTLDDVLRVRALGVTRVGATATEAILEEAKKRGYL